MDFAEQNERWEEEREGEEVKDEEKEDIDNLEHLHQISSDLQHINNQIRKLTAQKRTLEQQQQQIEQKMLIRKRKLQESLEPDWTAAHFPWSKSVQKLATQMFGFQSLRSGQLEIINAALSNYDVFAVMKTGGGKSLCYQLPAILNYSVTPSERKLRFTVVICPLLALIRDQVQGMNGIIPGSAWSLAGKMERSSQTAVYHAMNHLMESNLKLLYVTPEKIIKSKLLMTHLQRAYNEGSIQRIVIDEAHCASQW
jgi:hypothetical protein